MDEPLPFKGDLDPLQALADEAAAERAAKMGLIVGAYLALVYLVTAIAGAASMIRADRTPGVAGIEAAIALPLSVALLVLAVWLTFRIWIGLGRWPITIVGAWALIETLVKFFEIFAKGGKGFGLFALLSLGAAALAVLSIRGAWRLAALQRRKTPVEVFE